MVSGFQFSDFVFAHHCQSGEFFVDAYGGKTVHFAFDERMSEGGSFRVLKFGILFEEHAHLEYYFVKVFFFGVVV